MNVLGSISVMNEADGAYEWGNRIEWEQYAALLNAVYDGNDGKMGSGYGVKDADPDLPVSVTGLAFNLKSLIETFNFNVSIKAVNIRALVALHKTHENIIGCYD